MDSADANKAVVMADGYASETSDGPWLMSRDIKGVGVVGVWCSSWYLDGVGEICVDAQIGELYFLAGRPVAKADHVPGRVR